MCVKFQSVVRFIQFILSWSFLEVCLFGSPRDVDVIPKCSLKMISKLLSLFNNENPGYQGKRKTQSFLKEHRAHCKCTFPKSKHANYQNANAHMHVFVFAFLTLMPKKKAVVQIWIWFEVKT